MGTPKKFTQALVAIDSLLNLPKEGVIRNADGCEKEGTQFSPTFHAMEELILKAIKLTQMSQKKKMRDI